MTGYNNIGPGDRGPAPDYYDRPEHWCDECRREVYDVDEFGRCEYCATEKRLNKWEE